MTSIFRPMWSLLAAGLLAVRRRFSCVRPGCQWSARQGLLQGAGKRRELQWRSQAGRAPEQLPLAQRSHAFPVGTLPELIGIDGEYIRSHLKLAQAHFAKLEAYATQCSRGLDVS